MLTVTITEKDLFNAQKLHQKMSGAKTALFTIAVLLVGFYLYDEVGIRPAPLVFGAIGGALGVLATTPSSDTDVARSIGNRKAFRFPTSYLGIPKACT